jgi:hypothetical protein
MMHPRTKDMIYHTLPMGLLQQVLPRFAAAKSPFLPQIVAQGVIFIHVPKAAGSSLKTELYGKPLGGHRRIAEYVAYDGLRTQSFFKCSFVRNPWDRLLSAYSYLKNRTATSHRDRKFAETYLDQTADVNDFVLALGNRQYRNSVMLYDLFRPQCHWICMPGETRHAMDFIGRFETMHDDLVIMREKLGLQQQPLVQTRKSLHQPYQEVYIDRTRQIVGDIYAQDIELLGYSF